jgi:hypothetical protein
MLKRLRALLMRLDPTLRPAKIFEIDLNPLRVRD